MPRHCAYNGSMRFLAAAILAVGLGSGCVMDQFSPIPFEWVDLNQDGYIVFQEYFTYMSQMDVTPPFDLTMAWYSADDNRDGIITRYEQWSRLFPVNVVYRQRGTQY